MSVGQPPRWRVCQQGAADAAGGLCCSHSAFPAPTPERDEHASPLHPVLQLPYDRQQGRRCYNLLIFLSHVHILDIYDLIPSTLFWYSRRGSQYICTPSKVNIYIRTENRTRTWRPFTSRWIKGFLGVDWHEVFTVALQNCWKRIGEIVQLHIRYIQNNKVTQFMLVVHFSHSQLFNINH